MLLVRRGHRGRKSAHLIKIWCWRERAGRCRHQQTVQCSQPSAQSTQPAAGTANHQHSTQQTLYTGRATRTLLPPPPCLPAHHLNTKFPCYFFPFHGKGTQDQDAGRTHADQVFSVCCSGQCSLMCAVPAPLAPLTSATAAAAAAACCRGRCPPRSAAAGS